jgi:phosphate-selective porin OprO/OprP
MKRLSLLAPFILISSARADSFDEAWKLPVLYKNPTSHGLREFSLSANLQWQWADGDSDQGNFGTRDRPHEVAWGDVEIRRMELGF